MASKDLKSILGSLEDFLELYLVKKAPALPDNFREVIVKFAPWISLIFMIIAFPFVLALFGLGAILTPFSFLGGPQAGVNYLAGMVLSVVAFVLDALAIPGLFKRSKAGWNFAFYAALITAVQNLIRFDVGGLVIGTLLSLYFLFQIKGYYK